VPKGEKRSADVIGCAVQVGRLSVGMETEELRAPSGKVRSGHAGAEARSPKLTAAERQEIARSAAVHRWAGREK